MPNHLVFENSPYLLQHADNPVDWYPWGEEALAKARKEDKPIFLSIGYAACHWCHVMAHESFENEQTAALMNQYFVNIKVDREERPDLDGIYMQAVVAMTGRGGWPMSVFLTPHGTPFYGGTYFPPVRRYNMPSFSELLQTVARLWQTDRAQLLQSGEEITRHLLKQSGYGSEKGQFSAEVLDRATSSLIQTYDWVNGGWGSAPKFPQPMTIEFLLRRSTRGDKKALEIAVHALQAMAKGGLYDVVGGGFARYSTDDGWLVPHFEKMLYDNAQLALVYLHGWLISGQAHFRQVCEATLDFVVRELTHPQGGFYSSLDADSEGEEGKYYVWTGAEIEATLQDPLEVELFTAAYHITQAGNFEGKNVLQRALSNEALAARFNLPVQSVAAHLDHIHKILLAARLERIPPGTDDKILVSWNALMMTAFAEAARYLDRPDYLTRAQQNAHFLLNNLFLEGRMLRSWRKGQAKHNAYLEDYAALILGLLDLYQTDSSTAWYVAARDLTGEMLRHYADVQGGFFDTCQDHEPLLFRPKDIQDNATPSGNALAACALLQVAAYDGNSAWRSLAESMLDQQAELMASHPTAFAQWLQAGDFAFGPVSEVALLGYAKAPSLGILRAELWKKYRPRQISATSTYPPEPGSPRLLEQRRLVDDQPTAYVCQGFVCQQPVTTPEALRQQLSDNV